MYNEDYLKHYGVLGMKWGKSRTGGARKTLGKSALRKNFDRTKQKKKDAAADYSDAFDAVLTKSTFGRQGDRRINRMATTMDKSIKADTAYAKVKKQRKTLIKSKAKDLEAQASFKEKMRYNSATRKKAAKYIVDNDMSIADAKKRANEDAIRNTAILLAGYGAVAAGMAINKKING